MKPRTLEEKQDEKDRLMRKWRLAQRERWQALCEREPRLPLLRSAIRRTQRPAETLCLIVDSWARNADDDLRHAVLRQVDRHCVRMARYAGNAALDDPLPPATNVFFVTREMLGVR